MNHMKDRSDIVSTSAMISSSNSFRKTSLGPNFNKSITENTKRNNHAKKENVSKVVDTLSTNRRFVSTPIVPSETSIDSSKSNCISSKSSIASFREGHNEMISCSVSKSSASYHNSFEMERGKELSSVERKQKIWKLEQDLVNVKLSWEIEIRHIRQNMDLLRNEINLCKKSDIN